MKRRKIRSWSWLFLLALMIPFLMQSGASGQRRGTMIAGNTPQSGLQFRLSEGAAEALPPAQPVSAPRAEAISEAEAQNLLRRLPPIKADGEDEKEFALRDRSLPPPRTGQTINESFPPATAAGGPGEVASGPLDVLRFAPEGEIPLAPYLSVTFSQPMVPVTAIADLAAASVPVKLTPQPPGRWRWVGTKTLLFEPAGRFPMATSYTAEIPAGTKSATGGALGAAKRWTFATPPPQVKTSYPTEGPHSRNPVFFVEFDQRIELDSVLKSIRLEGGGRKLALRLATAKEIESDPVVLGMKSRANADCWIAFRAQGEDGPQPLAAATNYTVTLDRGLPSLEGPRTTGAPQTFAFQTYSPLELTRYECGAGRPCEPGWAWSLQFNNMLDQAAFDPGRIRIAPEIPGVKITNFGNVIQIQGATRGRTAYRVTIDDALKDVFGQTLGAARTVTFNVGSASPNLGASAEEMAVLDPYAPPRFSIFTVNHSQLKVTLYAAEPENWPQFAAFMGNEGQGRYRRGAGNAPMPPIGRLISSKVIPIANKPDDLIETQIDLKVALPAGVGHVILSVEAVQPPRSDWERRSLQIWIQATGIGLDAFVDPTQLLGWATSLRDGKPLGDVQITMQFEKDLAKAGTGVKAGADGLARISLPDGGGKRVLLARKGNDTAILPENFGWWDNGGYSQWARRPVSDSLRWHVFDDRGMYRPGEEVRIKGWLRRSGGGPLGDIGALQGAAATVNYMLRDARGNEVLKGNAQLNALGGFDASFKLPPTINLGQCWLALRADGGTAIEGRDHTHGLRVQEFRRPEYEVKVDAGEGPWFVGDHATLNVLAAYYAGGGLGNAEVNWNVVATPASYTPPNRDDFTFGKWRPWWDFDSGFQQSNSQQYQARTDASGKHRLRIDFDSINPPQPTSITAFANVQDVNRQNISGKASLLVHPSAVYVGLRSRKLFVQKGEPLLVESIVTDLDGKALVNREIRMRAVLLDWAYEKGEWRQVEKTPQECILKSGTEAVQCRFQTNEGGRYRVTARVIDDRERPNESELTLWVAGGKQPPQRDLAQEKVELIPGRKEYAPGETAELLLQAPFYPAEGVMTLRRSGMVASERFTINAPSHTLKIPIQDGYTPNVWVEVDLAGAAARQDEAGKPQTALPKRPAFASGSINLSIPPARRRLSVTAIPREPMTEPGASTHVDVQLRDADGKPVAGGEVALIVVDEAVLALSNYQLLNPIDTFYSQRGNDVTNHHLREKVQLAKPLDFSRTSMREQQERGGPANGRSARMMKSVGVVTESMDMAARPAPMAQMAMASAEPAPVESGEIRARLDFNALATFAAALPTDAEGRARVDFKLPDNLTRYRVMAVAVAGDKQFGTGESAVTARLPLMVRPSAPRFLNYGDRFELPIVVQNQTDNAMQVELAVRAGNAQLTAGTGRRVTVPANDRVEVRFPTTTIRPGTARFQVAGASGKWSDAAEISLPVWTPATTEAFATYGEVDAGAIVQPIQAPSDAVRQFGGLEVTTSSTQLQALTDAVLYLTSYPYDCVEQISSRVLAIAALRDVLGAFDAKGLPPADQLIAAVDRDLKRLESLQNYSGGFGFWRRGDDEWPYLGIHAAHAMQRAKQKGFTVPAEMQERSKNYIRTIEQHLPGYYSPETRRVLIAYSLFVRNLMEDRDTARASRLIREAGGVEKLPLEALGWILPVVGTADSVAIRRHLDNRVQETAAAAHFTTSYSDGAHLLLHSDRRADGILLDALIGANPKSDLIPKIVRGLLGAKRQGRWENTQENCFILLALDRYFNTYEKVTPDFVARVWLGDAIAGSHEFRGRTTERSQINVPMGYLMAQPAKQNLTLGKEGAGRLYYRIGMQYAPTSLQLKPADYGFTVTRSYEAIDNPSDVRRDEDGAWRIKAGAQVRVRLTMLAQARRYHVALVDPLPAGLEALNPELATTGPIPRDPKDPAAGNWWRRWGNWFEYQNMRDERIEAFTSMLWEGVYSYTYVARATTPGVFVVPPAKAEEMYHPETFGRSATDRVVVE